MISILVLDKCGISAVFLDHDQEKRIQNQLDPIGRNAAVVEGTAKGDESPQHDQHNRGVGATGSRAPELEIVPTNFISEKGGVQSTARL